MSPLHSWWILSARDDGWAASARGRHEIWKMIRVLVDRQFFFFFFKKSWHKFEIWHRGLFYHFSFSQENQAVLYQYALRGRKPIFKLKRVLVPTLRTAQARPWQCSRTCCTHSAIIECLLGGSHLLDAGDIKMNESQATPLGIPEPRGETNNQDH